MARSHYKAAENKIVSTPSKDSRGISETHQTYK